MPSTTARTTRVHVAEASREVLEEGCEEGGQKELRQGEESPHRARVGRSILYRQEGKNAHTCIPSALQTGME